MEDSVIQRIEEILVDNNLNKSQFSIKLGLDQKTVNCYMNKKRKFSFEFIEAIIKIFEISPDWLLLGKVNKSSNIDKLIEEMELKDQMILDLRQQIEKDNLLIEILQERLSGLKKLRTGALGTVGAA